MNSWRPPGRCSLRPDEPFELRRPSPRQKGRAQEPQGRLLRLTPPDRACHPRPGRIGCAELPNSSARSGWDITTEMLQLARRHPASPQPSDGPWRAYRSVSVPRPRSRPAVHGFVRRGHGGRGYRVGGVGGRSALDRRGARRSGAALSSGRCPALALSLDVSDAGQVEDAVAAHVERFGGVDVMVANAGIAVTASPAGDDRRAVATHPGRQRHGSRALPQRRRPSDDPPGLIRQGRGGRLMGAASVAAHRGGKWQGVYSASKFAVCGLSPSVAQELAEHQITPDHRQRLRPRRGAHGDGGLDRRRHGLAERHRARIRDGGHGRRDPAGTSGDPAGRCRSDVVPGLARCGLRHRPVDRRRRRHVIDLNRFDHS